MNDVRKLQRSGKTYYVYLPDAWITKNNLNPGSLIDLSDNQGALILNIVKKGVDSKLKEASVKLNNHNYSDFTRFILSLYLRGYDKFKIKLINPLRKEELKKLTSWLKKFSIDVIELDESGGEFLSTSKITDIKVVMDLILQKALNQLRAIKFNNLLMANSHFEDIDRNKFIMLRCINLAFDDYSYMKELNMNTKDLILYYDLTRLLADLSKYVGAMSKLKINDDYVTKLINYFQVLEVALKNPEDAKQISKLYDYVNKIEPELIDIASIHEIPKVSSHHDMYKSKIYECLRKIARRLSDNLVFFQSLNNV